MKVKIKSAELDSQTIKYIIELEESLENLINSREHLGQPSIPTSVRRKIADDVIMKIKKEYFDDMVEEVRNTIDLKQIAKDATFSITKKILEK